MIIKRKEQQAEVLEDGRIACRTSTIVIKPDGTELPPKLHRHVVDVDDDLTNQSTRVKAVAAKIWTQEVKDARGIAKQQSGIDFAPAVVAGIVEKVKIVNYVLASGAIVQQACDIIEEDGIEIGREYRPNRLIDVEDDTTDESEQVKGLALGTWTPDVITAANTRRAAIVADLHAKDTTKKYQQLVQAGEELATRSTEVGLANALATVKAEQSRVVPEAVEAARVANKRAKEETDISAAKAAAQPPKR